MSNIEDILTEEQKAHAEKVTLEDLWIEIIDSPVKLAKEWFWDLVQCLQSR